MHCFQQPALVDKIGLVNRSHKHVTVQWDSPSLMVKILMDMTFSTKRKVQVRLDGKQRNTPG